MPAPMDDHRDHGRYHMCACSNGWPGIMGGTIMCNGWPGVMGGTICVPAPMGHGRYHVCLLQWMARVLRTLHNKLDLLCIYY